MNIRQMKTEAMCLLKRTYQYFSDSFQQREALRMQCDKLLHDFAISYNYHFYGTVLVDAGWDNPNYWFRYSIFRAAMGLTSTKEVGIIGPFRRVQQKATLRRFGISEMFDFTETREFSEQNYELACRLCASLDSSQDILRWKLSYELPSNFLYDYILKKQRSAFVNIDDPRIIEYVHYFLNCISAAEKVLSQFNPDMVISSHAISWYVPLVWLALKRGIKVIVLFGNNGLLRFRQINHPSEIYNSMDHSRYEYYLRFSNERKKNLKETGEKYLNMRLGGSTNDLGSIYAYRKRHKYIDKENACSGFGWQRNKPIIGVYASNWFDFPHSLGMSRFHDFYDWIISTLEIAKQNKNVNWLFKAHPCDEWYGGITLKDIIKVDNCEHIKFVPKSWDSAALIKTIDAIVTYHGTIGLEATAIGKPVLVADKGWYHDWGFVKLPQSRESYFKLLNTCWWEGIDLEKNAELAQIFAGLCWGRPSWQKNFILEDDSLKEEIYKSIPDLLKNNKDTVKKEMETIREWIRTDYPHYHIYKMMQAEDYIV